MVIANLCDSSAVVDVREVRLSLKKSVLQFVDVVTTLLLHGMTLLPRLQLRNLLLQQTDALKSFTHTAVIVVFIVMLDTVLRRTTIGKTFFFKTHRFWKKTSIPNVLSYSI